MPKMYGKKILNTGYLEIFIEQNFYEYTTHLPVMQSNYVNFIALIFCDMQIELAKPATVLLKIRKVFS